MNSRPQPGSENRRSTRHPVDYRAIGEHRTMGDLPLHIVNLSAHGFMAHLETPLDKGERIGIRLPEVGKLDAHLIWSIDERSGFQFERVIRSDEFDAMIKTLQSPAMRRSMSKAPGFVPAIVPGKSEPS